MRKLVFLALVVALIASLGVACGPVAAPTPTVKRVLVGFTASQTGKLNKESKEQIQGLQLWLEDVKKAGGIKLKDGTMLMPEIKFYDDESLTDRVQALYTKLITEDKVDFLISPYSSGLTQTAAVVAEQYGKVMITTGAASDTTMEQGFKTIFQIYTPASRYLTGAVDLLQKLDPTAKKIAFVYEKERFSTDVTTFAQKYAKEKGFDIVLFEGYDTATTDFAPFINKIMPPKPDAIMGGGHFTDGTTFAKQLYEKKVPVKFVAILVAPPEPAFVEIGDAAQYVVGPSQWEPLARYSPESAKAAGLPWYGIGVADFTSAYKTKYGYEPSYHSAGGYAAGLIFQKGLEEADSVDAEKVKTALDRLDLLTFFGHIKFDTAAKTHGKQIGHEMVYVQWQKDAAGKLVKPVVWPLEGKSADAQLRKQ
ncbi:MAG: amino acid ABC transporter substrate-binding protein [Chloroflexi bacterium]|nr:amino acid ABC transporter substrate-binding protein [Chloroflexota bacterium]MBI5956261.1 amino acid ABC transporter substrate-binding protein [Chloroflexota bacterium]